VLELQQWRAAKAAASFPAPVGWETTGELQGFPTGSVLEIKKKCVLTSEYSNLQPDVQW